MKLLAYIRVSTVNQDLQGFSLDSQKNKTGGLGDSSIPPGLPDIPIN